MVVFVFYQTSSTATVGVVVLVYRIRRATPLAEHATDINIMLSLLLDGLPCRGLLSLFAVKVALQALLTAAGTRLLLDGIGDLALTRRGHLLGIQLVVAAYIFLREAFGFFAGPSTADSACY